jgi:hypothetical protein
MRGQGAEGHARITVLSGGFMIPVIGRRLEMRLGDFETGGLGEGRE